MAINLANLNISLDQFQKMATGDYNAGEVALKANPSSPRSTTTSTA